MTERTLKTKGWDKSAKGKCWELKESWALGYAWPLLDVASIFYSCHGKRGGEGNVSHSL